MIYFYAFRERENRMEYMYELDNLNRQLNLLQVTSEIMNKSVSQL